MPFYSSHTHADAFRKKIEPETGFTIITQNNLSDEYDKAKDADGNPNGGPIGVEQVPLVLAVKGPISLRRAGTWNDPSFWMTESYRVTVSKTGVV
tara:strand:+ start:2292 stop:2576 length:285 start_codon:yes stop_codon:yes gene_type:complete